MFIRSLFLLLMLIVPAVADAYEYPRYNIEATVDLKDKTLSAHQQVTFTNNTDQPTNVLYFHVYPNRMYTSQEKSFLMRYAAYFKIDPFPSGFPKDAVTIKNVYQGK